MAPLSTALAAVEPSRLNVKRPVDDQNLQKRKRGEKESRMFDEDSIVITTKDSDRDAVRLSARAVVSRTQIPLFYLDTDTCSDALHTSVFCGTIPVLERGSTSQQWEDAVLVAEDPINHALFVIEKVKQSVFVLCKLRSWVSLEDIVRGCFKRQRTEKPRENPQSPIGPWWAAAQVPMPAQKMNGQQTNVVGLRKRFTMRREAGPSNEEQQLCPQVLEGEEDTQAVRQEADGPENSAHPTTEDLLNGIRAHYLESLYISRTPLAYFAKGPLSRARAALRSQDAPVLAQAELVEFLRSCIMSLGMGNKKYDTGLAELVRELPPGTSLEDDDSHLTTPIKDKIRKSRKRKKMSKLGLVPGEEEYLLRWWVKREESLEYSGLEDTRESRLKSGLSEQRARETQLQIILILEVLALEDCTPKDGSTVIETTEGPDDGGQPKKKKPLDLMNILDILIDRLCIWESMNLDGRQPGKSATGCTNKSHKTLDTEQLRDFCTDVVVPYYATRLPDLYTSICQKLGGPSLASSPPALRTPAPKKPSTKKPAKKPTTNLSTRRPLVRSATDSALPPTLKRELSVSLADIPTHRPTLAQTGRYAQREVDLAAVAKASEARAARKAAAAAELQNAITTLRRPNARAAVRDLVDSADRRIAQGSKGRKARNPVRNPFATAATIPGVQVAATPKAGRVQHRAQYSLPPLPPALGAAFGAGPHDVDEPELPTLPSYVASDRVPGSTAKERATTFPSLADTPLRPAAAAASSAKVAESDVEATPSRRRARVVPARRPTNPIGMVPEIGFEGARSLGAIFGDRDRVDRVARSPLLQRSRTMPLEALGRHAGDSALLRTPSKAVRQVSFAAIEDRLGLADGVVADTPAKPAVTAREPEADQQVRSGSSEEVALVRRLDDVGDVDVLEKEGLPGKRSEETCEQDAGEQDIYAALGWNDEYDL